MGPYGFVLSGGQICFEIQRPLSGSRLNMPVLIAGLSQVPGRPELIDKHLWIYPTVEICEHTQNKRTLVTFLLPHKQSNMHHYLRHESKHRSLMLPGLKSAACCVDTWQLPNINMILTLNVRGSSYLGLTRSISWLLIVLPIDIENPYRLSNCLYRWYRYISGSWQLIFCDLYRNLPGGR